MCRPEDPIQAKHTDAAKLILEQVGVLIRWTDWQHIELFEDLSVAEVLAVYHASIAYDTFEGWCEEDPKAACAAYNRCVKDKARHRSPLDA